MPGVQHATQGDGWGMLLSTFLMIAPPLIMIALARRWKRRGKDMYIRRIPGIDAIEDAVGRTVEMGRPMLFTFGLAGVGPLFFACLGVLSHMARMAARYSTRLFVPQRDVEVMAITQNAVRECYQAEGRQEAYHEDDVRFLSGEQFAFASGYMGIAHREKVAACFLFGSFAAESLILAEAGQQVGRHPGGGHGGQSADSVLHHHLRLHDHRRGSLRGRRVSVARSGAARLAARPGHRQDAAAALHPDRHSSPRPSTLWT